MIGAARAGSVHVASAGIAAAAASKAAWCRRSARRRSSAERAIRVEKIPSSWAKTITWYPAWFAIPNTGGYRDTLREKARRQLGTVGSGNHYVDVFADETGAVWVGVHFGSRGFGHTVASDFLSLSQGGRWGERANEKEVLLDVREGIGHDYWHLMELAGRYAYAGREWVARAVVVTYLVPASLLFIPMFQVIHTLGLIDNVVGLMVTYLTFTVPFATWMMIGYFRSVPFELEDAAHFVPEDRPDAIIDALAD